jgi:SAM-dependent methyltransferase
MIPARKPAAGSPADWYRSTFGELYPLLYPHRDDLAAAREVEQLAAWLDLRGRKVRIADLGCGAARHTAALRCLDLCAIGLDLSCELLARARERADGCPLVRGDLRRLPFRPVFDVALSLFTSFGYFDDAENEIALSEMARVLAPGGRLLIDHIHVPTLHRTLVPEDTHRGPGCRITQRREIRDSRVRKTIVVRWDTGEQISLCEDVRLYLPEELARLLTRAGLRDVTFHGSYAGDPLSDTSARMIAVARRG